MRGVPNQIVVAFVAELTLYGIGRVYGRFAKFGRILEKLGVSGRGAFAMGGELGMRRFARGMRGRRMGSGRLPVSGGIGDRLAVPGAG